MSFNEIKKMIDDLLHDISNIKEENNRSFKRKLDRTYNKGIIDISLDDEVEIPKEKFETNIIKDYSYRILKLDRPSKRASMDLKQLNVATLKMYANLCNVLEEELNKRGTSVARLVSSLRRCSAYYDIYYTLYKIAEGTVISFYNPLADIDITRSLDILEDTTNKNIKNIIENSAKEFTKELKEADEDTRNYFKLTKNNKKSVWRDIDGSLREKYKLTSKEEKAIDQISKRNNILRKNTKATEILLDMYVSSIKASFDNDNINTINIITRTTPYMFSKNTLDSLLIYTESNIREKFKFFTSINTNEAIEMLKEVDEGKFFDYINNYQQNFLNDLSFEKVNEVYEDYFLENPTKYRDRINYIKSFDITNQIEILQKIESIDGFNKILNLLIKDDFEPTKIIALYFIYKNKINKNSDEKKLFELIREENYNEFKELVDKNNLTVNLIEDIMKLKNPQPKKINVDSKKLERSRVELSKTVNIVSQFFEEEEDQEIIVDDKSNIVEDDNDNYEDILREIIKNGSLSLDYIGEIALKEGMTANTYISKINDHLFDYVSDQSLIVEDDKVIIDEFYVEIIEELLNEN